MKSLCAACALLAFAGMGCGDDGGAGASGAGASGTGAGGGGGAGAAGGGGAGAAGGGAGAAGGGAGAAGGGGAGAAGGSGGSSMTGLWADQDGTPTSFDTGTTALYNQGLDTTQIAGSIQVGNVFASLSVSFPGQATGTFDCSSAGSGGSLVTYAGPDSNDVVKSWSSWTAGGPCSIDVIDYGTNLVGTFTADVQEPGTETISFTNGGFDLPAP